MLEDATQAATVLTPEQEAIAAAPPTARLLVTAGAGTGKTHVLVERLRRLADDYELNLANDVLVVSFSRAAVGEIRRRMRERGGAAAYGAVSTFDSFASQLLAQHSQIQALGGMGFDERIEAAIRLLESSDDARTQINRLQHVIVDEVQDLVGVRRELVQAILTYAGSGFTLFGDPAQGIYNFQAADPLERQVGSALFFDWVKRKLPGPAADEPKLSKNFRYETADARSAEWAGPLLNGESPDYRDILDQLEDGVYDLETVGGIDELVDELRARARRRTTDETIGILCRFNFEVLRISEKLASAGITHHYQRPASDRAVPAWVAAVLGGCDTSQLGHTAFTELAAARGDVPPNAWVLLKRFDPRGNRDMLDLQKVQERIRIGDVPTEIVAPTADAIVVSTIHRAKGLEFDRVLLFEPNAPIVGEDVDAGERARELYVARTRARRRYGVLSRGPREYAKKDGNPGDVWTVQRFFGRGRPRVAEIEVKGVHSWAQDPAGAFAFVDDAADLQRYIDDKVRPLDPLRLRRAAVPLPHVGTRFYYVIQHDGRNVGVADIGWIVKALCRPREERNWPATIDGLFVESVDTVAGTSAAGKRAGLTSSGLWLRVRPYGLGRLHWEKNG
jgi:hypothetical protein